MALVAFRPAKTDRHHAACWAGAGRVKALVLSRAAATVQAACAEQRKAQENPHHGTLPSTSRLVWLPRRACVVAPIDAQGCSTARGHGRARRRGRRARGRRARPLRVCGFARMLHRRLYSCTRVLLGIIFIVGPIRILLLFSSVHRAPAARAVLAALRL